MSGYASKTSVPISRSRNEIERTLIRYGADEFFYGTCLRGAAIGFKYKGRCIKYNVPLPERGKYPQNKTGEQKWEKECRRSWRVLLLLIKAKLEAITAGHTTFEDEFLAQTCITGGQTVSEKLQPQIESMLHTGEMPLLLTGRKHQ